MVRFGLAFFRKWLNSCLLIFAVVMESYKIASPMQVVRQLRLRQLHHVAEGCQTLSPSSQKNADKTYS